MILRRLLLSLCFLPTLALPVAAAPELIEYVDYEPTNEPMLVAPDETITEREFFLFALQSGVLPVETATQWRELDADGRGLVREVLVAIYQYYLFSGRYQELREKPPEDLRERALRILSAPVAAKIWADTIVRSTVLLYPEDVIYYYINNPGEFSNPVQVTAARLRVPIPEPVTAEGTTRARDRARELRSLALELGGVEPVLRRFPEFLPNDGEAVGVYTMDQDEDQADDAEEDAEEDASSGQRRQTGRAAGRVDNDSGAANGPEQDPQLLASAFNLGLAQISEPIQTRDAFWLMEVVDRSEPEPAPLTEVQKDIEEKLRAEFLPQQFDYLSLRKMLDARATNRGELYFFMPQDADILRVGDFALTAEEFARLFPDRVGIASYAESAGIVGKVNEIIVGEVITQELEEAGLADDPLYAQARQVARIVHQSTEWLRQRRAEMNPSTEEVRSYLKEHREQLFPSRAKRIWRLELSPRDPGTLRPGELDSLQIVMSSFLADLVQQAERRLADRARLSPATAYTQPQAAIDTVSAPRDQRLRMRFVEEGTFNEPQAQFVLNAQWDDLRVGEFSPPVRLRNGGVASYYVSEEVQTQPPPDEMLMELARFALTVLLAEDEVVQRVGTLREQGALEFHPLLAP